jgi:restriction system protein
MEQHASVDRLKSEYVDHDSDAVLEVCEIILSNSRYPEWCPKTFDCEYIPESKCLIVDYYLPRIEDLPSTKSVKYNQTQDKLVYAEISEAALSRLYEDVNYKIALRTLFELFHADDANALDSIVFNGIVDSIDKATGHAIKPCILSIQVSRSEFVPLNVEQLDPKAVSRSSRGSAQRGFKPWRR